MTNTDPVLTERVANAIYARVTSGEWAAGMWLRQNQLAADFAVSRTPIRSALQTLSEQGVVELIPKRGARIRVPTLRELRESYQVRAVLEGVAAAAAADLASQEQLDRLLAAERLFEQSVDAFARRNTANPVAGGARWQTATDQFHEVIHEAAHNEVLASTIATLHRRLPRKVIWGVLGDLRLLSESVNRHRAIREAIERRDGIAARDLMQAHVERSAEVLTCRLTTLPS